MRSFRLVVLTFVMMQVHWQILGTTAFSDEAIKTAFQPCKYASLGYEDNAEVGSPDARIVSRALQFESQEPTRLGRDGEDDPFMLNELCELLGKTGNRQFTISCNSGIHKVGSCDSNNKQVDNYCETFAQCIVAKWPPPGNPTYENFLKTSLAESSFVARDSSDPVAALKDPVFRKKLYAAAIFQAVNNVVRAAKRDSWLRKTVLDSRRPNEVVGEACHVSPQLPTDLSAFNDIVFPLHNLPPPSQAN